MRRSGISKCSSNSCYTFVFDELRAYIDYCYSQWHIGISATAKSLCPSCKSQQQRESEGADYTALLYCIPNPIVVHTLFSAVHLLLCGIGDGLHGYEMVRYIPFGILLHLSPNTCISRISFLFIHSSHCYLFQSPFHPIPFLFIFLSSHCC